MQHWDLGFCRRYGYPAEVAEHLHGLATVLDRAEIEGVLLVGSASRGELTYRVCGNAVDILSDYECIVATRRRLRAVEVRAIRESVAAYEQDVNRSTAVVKGIDLDIVSLPKLCRSRKKFFVYEAKVAGKPLLGTDLRPWLPTVSLRNLDWIELNEVLLHRLKAVLEATPRQVIAGGSDAVQDMVVWQYTLAKNTLDITTWLAPYVGVLAPRMSERVVAMNELFAASQLSSVMPHNFLGMLERSLRGKQQLRFGVSAGAQFRFFLRVFQGGVALVLGRRSGAADSGAVIDPRDLRYLYARRTVRQAAGELERAMMMLWRRPGAHAIRWWVSNKRAVAAAILFAMLSCLQYPSHTNERRVLVRRAATLLRRLHPDGRWAFEFSGDPVSEWEELRKGFGDFWDYWYSSPRSNITHENRD